MHNWPGDVAADNDTIAFSGMRDGIWNIYTVSRKTKKVTQVTRLQKPRAAGSLPGALSHKTGSRL